MSPEEGMMSSGKIDMIDGANNEYLCRIGTRLLVIGSVIAALGGLFVIMALNSILSETEADTCVIILPQIFVMVVGIVMAGTGWYYRYRHCV